MSVPVEADVEIVPWFVPAAVNLVKTVQTRSAITVAIAETV